MTPFVKHPFFVDIILLEGRTINSRSVLSDEYVSYNRLVGKLQQFAKKLAELPPDDEFRIQTTEKLVKKLYDMGILLSEGSLAAVETIHASAFCKSICDIRLISRRRLGVMLIHMKMAHNLEEADNLIRHVGNRMNL